MEVRNVLPEEYARLVLPYRVIDVHGQSHLLRRANRVEISSPRYPRSRGRVALQLRAGGILFVPESRDYSPGDNGEVLVYIKEPVYHYVEWTQFPKQEGVA